MKISTPNSFSSPSTKSSIKKGGGGGGFEINRNLLHVSPFPKVRNLAKFGQELVLGQSSEHTDFVFGGHKLEVSHYIIPSPVGKNVHFPA